MHLHHRCGLRPAFRAALEVVLAGGLLTEDRLHRTQKRSLRHCPRCRGQLDTPAHRFWRCTKWSVLRSRWIDSQWNIPAMTRAAGLVPRTALLNQTIFEQIQTHMAYAVMESAEHHRQDTDIVQEPDYEAITSTALPNSMQGRDQDGMDGRAHSAAPPPLHCATLCGARRFSFLSRARTCRR